MATRALWSRLDDLVSDDALALYTEEKEARPPLVHQATQPSFSGSS
jgi:hypothetical protein